MLAALGLVLAVFVWRLIDLQVVHARDYREQAERALLRPARVLPFVRGRILDRQGRELASDQPCWQISVSYGVLSGQAAREHPETAGRIESMWGALADFAAQPVETLRKRGNRIVDRVRRWREAVSESRGYNVTIREEQMVHAIVDSLDDQQQIAARKRFAAYPWVAIEHGLKRVYEVSPSVGHIVGQLGRVDKKTLRNDPAAEDSLKRYLATDHAGISGVEYAAESMLRGRRGRLRTNRRREVVEDVPAVEGRDISLTLRLDLQDRLYALFGEMVPSLERAKDSPGGAIVVLHVPTREVLALVSYPGYDANEFRARYDEMRADTRHTPLRFRAVANAYEPGSTVKPLTCLAGLGTGLMTVDTTFRCRGHYLENDPTRWRCWQVASTGARKVHGEVNVSGALAGSCNVFMYTVAELVGAGGLCELFGMAGFGRTTGIGLLEERRGINPTPSWLMRQRGVRASKGRARNFAIGQGELNVTPLQLANLMALYADGQWKAVTLLRGGSAKPAWRLPVEKESWAAVRDGLYRVTNDVHGTAYHRAHWTNDRYALCGKTGSATTFPSPTHYRIIHTDANGQLQSVVLPGKVKSHAIKDFVRLVPDAQFDPDLDVAVEAVWPPPKPAGSDDRHAHAWFAGYLQPIDLAGRPLADRTPPIAFAVLVEFGGSGGHTTGPIAREIARIVCETFGENLDPDHVRGGPGA